jgi:hypothetical protein
MSILSLTNFIKKCNHIYDTKQINYENPFHDLSSDTNLVS